MFQSMATTKTTVATCKTVSSSIPHARRDTLTKTPHALSMDQAVRGQLMKMLKSVAGLASRVTRPALWPHSESCP